MNDSSDQGYYRVKSFDEVRSFIDELGRRVRAGQFKVSEREDKNLPFIRRYNLAGKKRQGEMLLALSEEDFIHAVPSKMEGNEEQELFVFVKEYVLHEMLVGLVEKMVYIKIDMIPNDKQMAIIVSFHESERTPDSYPYK